MPYDFSKKILILDRDGVINYDSDDYIKSPSEFLLQPRSIVSLNYLSSAGWRVAIATNQSGIGRSLYSSRDLFDMHKKLSQSLISENSIDYIAYCPHHPADLCACRKPKTGLFAQISNFYDDRLLNVPYIGDTLHDIEAAFTYGLSPVLVLSGKLTFSEFQKSPYWQRVPVFKDLLDFVESNLY